MDIQTASWEDLLKAAEASENKPVAAPTSHKWSSPTAVEDMMELDSDLPSNCFFYNFSDKLRIRQLQLADVERLIVAATQDNEFLVADTVARCISWPVKDLTLGDYYFLLYWLRLNSYPKSPLVITWHCPACMARAKTNRGLDYDHIFDEKESMPFKRVSRVDNNGPTIIPILEQDVIDMPSEVSIPRIHHWIDYVEWQKKTNPDEGRALSAKYALYLQGDTFAERLNRLVTSKSLELYELARAAAYKYGEHGPSENALVKCSIEECGASYEVPLVVRSTRFLSSV